MSSLSSILESLLNKFNKPIIGVDLGSRTVKGVQLQKRGKKVVLEKYFFTDMATAFPNFPAEKNPSQVLMAMSELHQLRMARAATAIPDDQVFNFELQLPQMPKSELIQAVHFEVSNRSRIPDSELVVDFWIENEGPVPAGAQLKIRAFAARTELVRSVLDRLSEASLRAESIESVMLANVEALRHNGYITSKTQCVIIDLGDTETVTAFVRQGSLHYSRSEKTGSGTINEALRGRLAISHSEAEKTKLQFSFASAGDFDPDAKEAIDAVYERLFRFIKDAVEGYLETTHGIRLEAIYLVGGASGVAGLASTIEGFFGIPTSVPNPFKNIELYTDPKAGRDDQIANIAPQLTTAVGLALRNIN